VTSSCARPASTAPPAPTPPTPTSHSSTLIQPSEGSGHGGPCPAGSHCPSGVNAHTPCNVGSYQPATQQESCLVCMDGYDCDEEGISDLRDDLLCSAGYYCVAAVKEACPAGTYRGSAGGDSSASCVTCPAGKYCVQATVTPADCVARRYCEAGATGADDDEHGGLCEPGYYCPEGAEAQVACSKTFYCSGDGNFQLVDTCSAGYYCPEASISATQVECPAGSFCPAGSGEPVECSPGTYNPEVQRSAADDCVPCPAGYYCDQNGISDVTGKECSGGFYCPGGQSSPNPAGYECMVGFMCPAGSSHPIKCSATTYQQSEQEEECEACPDGSYCGFAHLIEDCTFTFSESECQADVTDTCSITVSDPVVCEAGYYCTGGIKHACPEGTYNDQTEQSSESACLSCSVGKYCSGTGNSEDGADCDAGYFCTGGASVPNPVSDSQGGQECERGYWCGAGTTDMEPCTVGTFNPNKRGSDSSACEACTGGWYCATEALEEPTEQCQEEYFCEQGAKTGNPDDDIDHDPDVWYGRCTVGHYCPEGTTTPISCEPGTYADATANAECTECGAGRNCSTTDSEPCPEGYYCEAGTVPQKCPAGKYGDTTGLESSDSCQPCALGRYCDIPGITATTVEDRLCTAGYFCDLGSISRNASHCGAGYYCETGTTERVPCPEGTYGPAEYPNLGLEAECLLCTAGKRCPETGLTEAEEECPAGYYCETGTSSNEQTCQEGHYCPEGAWKQEPCPAGTFQENDGMDECADCQAGYYCVEGTAQLGDLIKCPAGYWCEEGTRTVDQNPCPSGTYLDATGGTSEEDCRDCPGGFYCPSPGQDGYPDACVAGFYCGKRQHSGEPARSCIEDETGDAVCSGPCEPGYYCPEGSDKPIQCPEGFYCPDGGATDVTAGCSAGYFCNGTSPESNPDNEEYGGVCPAGYYCPAKTVIPVPCEPGTYNDDVMQNCPGGRYCPNAGTTDPDVEGFECPEEYYCPVGSSDSNAHPCGAGYYCPAGSEEEQACTQGYYRHALQCGVLRAPV